MTRQSGHTTNISALRPREAVGAWAKISKTFMQVGYLPRHRSHHWLPRPPKRPTKLQASYGPALPRRAKSDWVSWLFAGALVRKSATLERSVLARLPVRLRSLSPDCLPVCRLTGTIYLGEKRRYRVRTTPCYRVRGMGEIRYCLQGPSRPLPIPSSHGPSPRSRSSTPYRVVSGLQGGLGVRSHSNLT